MAEKEEQRPPMSFFDQMMFGGPRPDSGEEDSTKSHGTGDQPEGQGGSWLFGGWGTPVINEETQAEKDSASGDDPLADEEEPTQEEIEQMERTLEQIEAVMNFAHAMKPYIKHLSPVWDALKKFANSPEPAGNGKSSVRKKADS
ncbi:hypothetical protein CR205_02305 [Alteribacter lacisalsi]|uniref:Uncharacterized protein n=1 Tax=Alteribacter lacisalsi TaxID=2045244 RepID=A0A2W0HBR4_9BACI|nr:hypothetical protein [Alteribacter lacisalsi]PYZ97450.1 hypothetical protein CR205_02305 [Alteribacter lacisalsi]